MIPVSLAKTRLRRKSRDKIGAFAGVLGPTVEKIAKVGINFRANARATGSDSADGSGLGRSGEKKWSGVHAGLPLSALLPDPI